MEALTISKAAKEAGVGVETIRFYERRGLIEQPPKPSTAGYRIYSAETVERVRFIRRAQEIGLSLREIQQLLSLRADPAADCADVRAAATAKLEEVERKIEDLNHIRAALRTVINACPTRGALEGCTILQAMTAVQSSSPDRILSSEPAE